MSSRKQAAAGSSVGVVVSVAQWTTFIIYDQHVYMHAGAALHFEPLFQLNG